MRQPAVISLLAATLSLTGCNWAESIGGRVNPESMGLADRCYAVMREAIPYAVLDIGKRTSQNKGISIITAHVEARRIDHPGQEGVPRDLAADCEFVDTVLASFHLTGFAPGQDSTNH
jgi:hypothetical protein